MKRWFKLSDEDRKTYDCDEWLLYDSEHLDDIDAATLINLEGQLQRQLDTNLTWLEALDLQIGTLRGRLGGSWIAYRLAGGALDLKDFTPKPRRIEVRREEPEADAGPPELSATSSAAE